MTTCNDVMCTRDCVAVKKGWNLNLVAHMCSQSLVFGYRLLLSHLVCPLHTIRCAARVFDRMSTAVQMWPKPTNIHFI